jgi:MarR family transcriptional regulator, 2-MHQ and catechol-resistance regulon repressor
MSGHLQREIKKRRPFESLEQEALLNLVRTNDRFQFRFARLFREHGLTPSQYNVLRILRGEGKPLPCLEIADRLIAAVPAITGLIDRLEAMNLVARDRSTEDRRVVFVEITPKAVDLLARIDQPVDDLGKKLIGHLTQAELRELSRLLEKARLSLTDGYE